MATERALLRRRIRILLGLFMIALVVSGMTAFPLKAELDILARFAGEGSSVETVWPQMAQWLFHVHRGISSVYTEYPFMAYGTS